MHLFTHAAQSSTHRLTTAMKDFGNWLKQKRLEADMTQEDVAEGFKVSTQSVQRYENGRFLKLASAVAMGKVIGIPPVETTKAYVLFYGGATDFDGSDATTERFLRAVAGTTKDQQEEVLDLFERLLALAARQVQA